MKEKLTDEVKNLFMQGKEWAKLEIEYAKLTAAEKFTILISTFIIGAICLLMGMVVLILLSLSLAELFKLMMAPALAYLSSAGVICILALIMFFMRRPLMVNPVSRFITKLFFSK